MPREPKKIDQMFAFVVEEEDGGEGVAAWRTSTGWMPLVGADMQRVESLRHVAQLIADTTGRPIKLVKFSQLETVEQLRPKEWDDLERRS